MKKQREVFQKEKADIDRMIKSDRKTTADLNTKAYEKKRQQRQELSSMKEKENGFQRVLTKPSEILGLKIEDLFEKR